MTRIVPRPHDKWAQWTDEEIQKYLDKYRYPTAPGKFSSHRRKKIRFLQGIRHQRVQAMLLINAL